MQTRYYARAIHIFLVIRVGCMEAREDIIRSHCCQRVSAVEGWACKSNHELGVEVPVLGEVRPSVAVACCPIWWR